MSVNPIGSIAGTTSVTDAGRRLQRAQRRIAADLATKAVAANERRANRDAASRSQQATEAAKAVTAAEQRQNQLVLPVAQTPVQQSKPITASNSALGGSFDVMV